MIFVVGDEHDMVSLALVASDELGTVVLGQLVAIFLVGWDVCLDGLAQIVLVDSSWRVSAA